MERRKRLKLLFFAVTAVGMGAVLAIFMRSMLPAVSTRAEKVLVIKLDDIPLDSYGIYEWNNRQIAVFRPGEQSVAYLREINGVAGGHDFGEGNLPPIFAYEPISTYRGCELWDSRKNASLWPKYRGWYDPCHMGFWDYSGRNLPGVMAPADAKLPDLKTVFTHYQWLSESIIELHQ